ncbi:MAG: aminotransferase class V-fold PLP-dependent enzyme [Rhizobium sp.]
MAYFANGSITPAARPVIEAGRAWQDQWAHDPQVGYRRYPQLLEQLRSDLAAFLGCDADEIAITDNTSRGSVLAVRALAGRGRGHVIVDKTTYPSSRYPWLALTENTLVHVDDGGANGPQQISSRITDDTCAVAISHVDWFTGVRHDVETLAQASHAKGALLIVDGSQSIGAFPVNVRKAGMDVLVGTFGKWLMGGPGLGFIYMKRSLLILRR